MNNNKFNEQKNFTRAETLLALIAHVRSNIHSIKLKL